jgi:hypothetical protein
MRNIFSIAIALLVLLSCQKDDPVLSSDNWIQSFSFLVIDNPSLSDDVHGIIAKNEIHVSLPTGILVTSLKPSIVHRGNLITPASGTPVDFSNPVNYTVTAEDNSTCVFTILATVAPPVLSSNKTITSFSFLKVNNPTLSADVPGVIDGQSIVCTVPAGIVVTGLIPTITHTGKSVNPGSETANNFSTPAIYTVTAEDGSTQAYTVTLSVMQEGRVVYVAGGKIISGTSYVTIWKDGVETTLTNGAYNASGSSVFVSDDAFYVAGYQSIGHKWATYWIENGIASATQELNETINDAYANSIYVAENNDVYVAGQENHGAEIGFIAKVWKNGVATALTTKSGAANSVFVSGNDVYVAGWEETATGWNAKVWKNGNATTLSPDDIKSQAFAVFVSTGNVYVAGQYWNGTAYVIKVWKNGVAQVINPDTEGSDVSAIFVSNDDVYLAGREVVNNASKAKIWKNGVETVLSDVHGSEARSIHLYNGDVYVAGWEPNENGTLVAMLWKNGEATPLATNAFAYSVMVK